MKINKTLNKNAQKWLKALLSGKYKQGTKHLHSGNRFCCLGVACELAIADGVPVKKNRVSNHRYEYDQESGRLPHRVVEWLGLSSEDGNFEIPVLLSEYKQCYDLTELNDDAEYSFGQIAAFVNAKPAGLFEEKASDGQS